MAASTPGPTSRTRRTAATSQPGRRIAAVCVVADRVGGNVTTPCGGCRQRLAEFAAPDTLVEARDPSGEGRTFRMSELLPAAFFLKDSL